MSKPVHLIFGNDEYLVSAKAKKIIAGLIPETEMALKLETVDGDADTVDAAIASLRQCTQALRTVGLLSAEKVVWFRDISFLADNRTSQSEDIKEELARFTDLLKQGLPDGQTLVMTTSALDKRRAFVKTCQNVGNLHEFSLPEESKSAGRRMLADHFKQIAAKHGLQFSSTLRDLFLEKVGADTRQLLTEAGKLAVFLADRKKVTREDIEQITCSSREALAWDLADAFGRRDLKRALAILRQLLFQKESAIRLVIGLEGRIKDLLIYREALDRGWLVNKGGYGSPQLGWGEVPPEVDAILKDDMGRDPRKVHPYRASLLAEQAGGFSQTRLAQCLRDAVEAHEKLVSTKVPHATVLELLLIRMLT